MGADPEAEVASGGSWGCSPVHHHAASGGEAPWKRRAGREWGCRHGAFLFLGDLSGGSAGKAKLDSPKKLEILTSPLPTLFKCLHATAGCRSRWLLEIAGPVPVGVRGAGWVRG
jgi:hypothetical protein